jgi:lysophospholipase L1-like esterase
MLRRRGLAASLCAAFVAALALPAGALADPGPYVALGDSYTAGPLVLNLVGNPIGCGRSDRNYPALVKAAAGITQFRDVSCSGATTVNMTAAQPVLLGRHAPQFDALRADLKLVTVGIGGNDVGLVGVATRCLGLGLLAPTGNSCRRSFAKPGGDRIVDQIAGTAPRIAATLQGIHERSPRARVLIVGYPAVMPHRGRGCYPLLPLSLDDIAYIDVLLRRTNAMLAEQAAANDAEYVDTFDESIGHDLCAPLGTRWFEGLLPMAPAFPLHPNALGEAGMARSVMRVLDHPPLGASSTLDAAPALSALRRSRRTISAGRTLRVAYTLGRAASVTFTLQRSRGGGRYTAVQRLLTVNAAAGDNVVTLTARMLGRRAGLYRVTADAGDGATQRAQFRIRRARSDRPAPPRHAKGRKSGPTSRP